MSIRRNTVFNLLGSGSSLAISLITIPIYIGLIGEARYGVLAIAWLLLGYFGVFDLGLGRATAQRIAALRAGAAAERAQTFWTALALNVGLGIAGGLLIWPVASYFFANYFKIEDALRPEVQGAIHWLILAVPMATLSGVLTGALQGRERFLELNLISFLGTVLFQILPLGAAVFWEPNLSILLASVLSARALTLIMLFQRCGQHVFGGHIATVDRALAGQLLHFGGWVTVTSFVGPLMVILDRFIIGVMAGAKAVTYYTVPFQLGERTTIIAGALSSALFPRFAGATLDEEQRLASEGLRTLLVVMTPLVVLGVLVLESFMSWWISAEFARQSAEVGRLLLIGFWINSFAMIPYAQLQARGRPDLVAKCHLAEVLPYFALLYLGLSTVGMIGAAAAFSLRVVVDFFLLTGLAGNLRQALRSLLVPTLLLGLAFFIGTRSGPEQAGWLAMAALNVLVVMAWAWYAMPASLRGVALAWLGRLMNIPIKL